MTSILSTIIVMELGLRAYSISFGIIISMPTVYLPILVLNSFHQVKKNSLSISSVT